MLSMSLLPFDSNTNMGLMKAPGYSAANTNESAIAYSYFKLLFDTNTDMGLMKVPGY